MSIHWMDNFFLYGTDGGRDARLFNGVYADDFLFTLHPDPDPSAGGEMVLRGDAGGTGGFLRKVLDKGPQTTIGSAARFWLSSLDLGNGRDTVGAVLFAVSDVSNIQHCYISVDATGYIRAFRSVNGPVSGDVQLGVTATPVVTANSGRHIECKVVLDNAAGSVEVRIEGIQVLHVTGVKTTSDRTGAGVTAANVLFKTPAGSSCQMSIKDWIVWDGSGTSNNDFMGSCLVYTILPDGDDALNWTPSSGGTGYSKINENTPDDDAGYIAAPYPPPAASSFTLTDLPINVTSVRGVMPVHRSRKTDGGDGNVQTSLLSGANTGNGTDRAITSAFTYWWDIFDKDPSGGNWSRVLVNALKLKINRTV